MQAGRARAESALDRVLPPAGTEPARLHEAMRYATLGGGKRVRALLVYAAGEWAASRGSRDADQRAVDAAACAVELIHAYSLVHDDLPAMDDDAMRRGRPTVHIAYDEATALLVGDALQALAFGVLADVPASDRVASHVVLLAHASGSLGMAGGQAIDLESVGKALSWSQLETMHRAKTGALLKASVMLGATAAHTPPGDEQAALDRYAAAVGLAFQVVDDVLDVETDSATLGKTAGKDAMHDKPTVVTTLGLEGAKVLARTLRDDAYRALDALDGDTGRLREIAAFVIGRSF
ncbi:MAG: farnesyl diphosphate synthase [Burkholderiaceae bacterium]